MSSEKVTNMAQATCSRCAYKISYLPDAGDEQMSCPSCGEPIAANRLARTEAAPVWTVAAGANNGYVDEVLPADAPPVAQSKAADGARHGPPSSAMADDGQFPTVDSGILKELGPDLYRANAFRAGGLAVDATAREIARQFDRILMMEKLGGAGGLPAVPLPLDPPPTVDIMKEALERLRDPEKRFVDEFFWFWPATMGGSREDAGLAALTAGNLVAAKAGWQAMMNDVDLAGLGRHNLAVLAHVAALDLEHQTLEGKPLDQAASQARDHAWRDAFEHWRLALEDDILWQRVARRVRDLNEPQLTQAMVRRLRQELPGTLLSITGRLAVQAAEQGKKEDAARLVALLLGSGFPRDTVEEAQRQAVQPIRQRINHMGSTAEAETDANPEQGNEISRRLLVEITPLLGIVEVLLPDKSHPLREGISDEVALRLLGCQISFGNKTEKWKASVQLLKHAVFLAGSESVRNRIEQNLEVASNNLKFSSCWFCQDEPPVPEATIEVPMHGNVTREYVSYNTWRVRWQYLTVKVPRCLSCRKEHRRREKGILLGGLLGFLAGLGGFAIVDYATGKWFFGLLLISASIIVGGLIASWKWMRAGQEAGVEPLGHKKKFHVIQDLRKQGWVFGSKPSNS